MKTNDELLEIAEEIAEASAGCVSLQQIESEEQLTPEEHIKVMSMVYTTVDNCGLCGWVEYLDSMNESKDFDELICWRCEATENEEAEYE